MSLTGKTLWFIESNLSGALTLNDLAAQAGVTPFHLARVFVETTGHPVMRYVWRRRLARAMQALAYGPDSVLTIALDAGYASPEAFSRACRTEFGLTPRQIRTCGLQTLTLTHPIQPRTMMDTKLTAPKIEVFAQRRFAGPVRRYNMTNRSAIPAQWADYNNVGTRVVGAVPDNYYGLCFNFSEEEGSFDYMCGQEVPARAALPGGFSATTLQGRYARFDTKGHISTMSAVWAEVFGTWLQQPGLRPRPGPSVEYYPPEFNGMTGDGGFEIWVAVED
jgi:AraC family transcriptional regulator